MVKVSVLGATGYTGIELVRILGRHPEVKLTVLSSQSFGGQKISSIYPHLWEEIDLICNPQDLEKICAESELVFLALPHGQAKELAVPLLAAGKKIIDLGADFRLAPEVYRQWYRLEPPPPEILARAVYGLPELYRALIPRAEIIANPGCYPTSVLLLLAPALKEGVLEPKTIVIDAKSGVSGAGRQLTLETHYSEANEDVHPYGVAEHRHTPEIEQELSRLAGEKVTVSFTPHLVPMTRGILSTVYASLKKPLSPAKLQELYCDYYQKEPFVKVLPLGKWPHTKFAYGANTCYLGVTVDTRTERLIGAAALDNLVKGAAGQAIQNLNLVCGYPETTGLEMLAIYP